VKAPPAAFGSSDTDRKCSSPAASVTRSGSAAVVAAADHRHRKKQMILMMILLPHLFLCCSTWLNFLVVFSFFLEERERKYKEETEEIKVLVGEKQLKITSWIY
jgi:hypothetical protein